MRFRGNRFTAIFPLLTVLLFLVLAVPSFGDGSIATCDPSKSSITPSGAVDITCPPPPNTNDGVCSPKCPAGWGLAPLDINYETGAYVCQPSSSEEITEIFASCIYYDYDCIDPSKNLEKLSNEIEKATKELTDTSSSITFSKAIVGYATLDPEVVYSASSSKKGELPFFEFFSEILQTALEYFREIGTLYGLFGFGWLGLLYAGEHFFRDARLGNPARTFGRVLLFLSIFFAPLPAKTPDGTIKSVDPFFFRVFREVMYQGTELADSLALKFNLIAVSKIIDTAQKTITDDADIERALEFKKRAVQNLEQDLRNCWHYYGACRNFIVPDEFLSDITPVAEPPAGVGAKKGWYYSVASCREIEKKYKQAVVNYNLLLAVKRQNDKVKGLINLSSYDIKGIFENPEKAVINPMAFVSVGVGTGVEPEKASTVKVFGEIAKAQKRLGWVGYAAITLPTLFFYVSIQDDLSKLSIEPTEPNFLLKAMAYATVPPGKDIFIVSNDLMRGIGDFIVSLLPIDVLKKIPFVGEAVEKKVKTLAKGAVAGGSAVVSLVLTYILVSFIFAVLPTVAITVAFVIKLLSWLVDVVKYLAVSPFVALHAFSTSEYRNAYAYVIEGMALAVFPLAMLLVASFTYFAMFLFKGIFYFVMAKAITTLANLGLIKVLGSSTLGRVMSYFVLGLIFVLAIFGQVLIGYKFMSEGLDWIIRKSKWRIEPSGGVSQAITERLVSRGAPV